MVSDGYLGWLKIAWAGPQKLCVLGETPLAAWVRSFPCRSRGRDGAHDAMKRACPPFIACISLSTARTFQPALCGPACAAGCVCRLTGSFTVMQSSTSQRPPRPSHEGLVSSHRPPGLDITAEDGFSSGLPSWQEDDLRVTGIDRSVPNWQNCCSQLCTSLRCWGGLRASDLDQLQRRQKGESPSPTPAPSRL